MPEQTEQTGQTEQTSARIVSETSAVFSFDAIGTSWRITTAEELDVAVQQEVLTLCEDVDRIWSRFRLDSLVTEIAHAPDGGLYSFPERDLPLLVVYDQLAAASDGAVDPLVGRDLELLGYDADYTLRPDPAGLDAHVPDAWLRDIHRSGSTIRTERPLLIDVGAAGKGHLVDVIADLLQDSGVDEFLVDGSGDLRHRGRHPTVAGLEHPTLTGRVIGTVPLKDSALCASAINRRTWGESVHHVLDGRTGKPVSEVIATWAIAADARTADGLATALFVSGPEQLGAFSFSWLRMLADGRVQWSNDFPGELFI